MADDPSSLSNLKDLALPDPVSWWPPAAGVWILAATIAGLCLVALTRAIRRWRADAYRRAAEAELDAVDEALSGRNTARRDVTQSIFAILKRTALAAYPRVSVASLTGEALVDFLLRTSARPLNAAALRRSAAQVYGGCAADAASSRSLLAQARLWVGSHRAPDDDGGERQC